MAAAVVAPVLARIDSERAVPRFVKPNERAVALAGRADELVDDDVDDATAVAELCARAGGRGGDLKIASALARQSGLWAEVPRCNRAVRLLEAAATRTPVAPPSPDHVAAFAVLGRLFDLPPSDGLAELAARVPALLHIERSVRTDAARAAAAGLGPEAFLAELASPGLGAVVGPTAASTDPVVRSHVAWHVAHGGLIEAARQSYGL